VPQLRVRQGYSLFCSINIEYSGRERTAGCRFRFLFRGLIFGSGLFGQSVVLDVDSFRKPVRVEDDGNELFIRHR